MYVGGPLRLGRVHRRHGILYEEATERASVVERVGKRRLAVRRLWYSKQSEGGGYKKEVYHRRYLPTWRSIQSLNGSMFMDNTGAPGLQHRPELRHTTAEMMATR